MFTFGRSFAAPLALASLFFVCLGCSAITSTDGTPTSQTVCSAYESGVGRCGSDFDTNTCVADLACNLSLYRSEAIDLILSCVDRFKHDECPSFSGYFCTEPEDVARRAAFVATPMMNDYAKAFLTKREACATARFTLDSSLYDARMLMADKLFYDSRPCLDAACSQVNQCLVSVRQILAPFCP